MSAARHHHRAGTFTDDQLRSDIQADIAAARGAEVAGASSMRSAADEYLDELGALNSGVWRPKHA